MTGIASLDCKTPQVVFMLPVYGAPNSALGGNVVVVGALSQTSQEDGWVFSAQRGVDIGGYACGAPHIEL